MRKEIRRIVMFCTILTVGLLLLFIDVTFIQLILLLFAIAALLPFLLGLVTVAEARQAFTQFKEQRLNKIGLLKKLDSIKLFEKTGSQKQALPQPKAPVKAETPPQKTSGGVAGKPGIPFAAQITSLVGTLKSFGSVLKARVKEERKVSDINTMLDKTVSQKVEIPAVAATPPATGGGSLPGPGSGAEPGSAAEEDPFLSLSGDDFDTGLLDGLDDDGAGTSVAAPSAPGLPGQDLETGLPEPELSGAPADLDSAAGLDSAANDILKAHGGEEGLDEFKGLEDASGGDSDADLGDLDNISLDDVDLDADLGDDQESAGTAAAAPQETPAPAAGAAAAPPKETAPAVKTAWIPSDAPKSVEETQDQIGTQSDMASFAQGATGSDEDLLSSISSDVKRTVKQKDTSLLRELKDFRAPAAEIEKELTDMFQKMSTVQKPKERKETGTNGVK